MTQTVRVLRLNGETDTITNVADAKAQEGMIIFYADDESRTVSYPLHAILRVEATLDARS